MANCDTPTCDVCGGRCIDGYELRDYGVRDSQTGYIDQEIVCGSCLDYEDSDEDRYVEADRQLTGVFEES